MALKLPRLPTNQQIVDEKGYPTTVFVLWWAEFADQIETSIDGISVALEAAGIALDAADAAQAAADAADAAAIVAQDAAAATALETSIVNSFVKDFAGASPLEADSSGNVTIKNHTRQYGDTVLNPDVSITGSVVATGAAATSVVRFYYDDATRTDTTPTFAFTTDPALGPIQGGDRHVIGAVEIPAAGSSDGGFVREPGFTGIVP